MKTISISAALLLAACTTTPGALSSKPVTAAIDSTKAPRALALCLADNMTSATVRDEGDGRFAVIRDNGFGAIGRWDIFPSPTGSRAEWRRAGDLTTGAAAGEKCA